MPEIFSFSERAPLFFLGHQPGVNGGTPAGVDRLNPLHSDEMPTGRAELQAVEDSSHLALSAASGDVAAFESLYRNEMPYVYGLCLRMTGDQQEAQELTQDIFIRAWDQLDKFHGGNFGAWIYSLGRNLILNDRRTRARFSRLITFEDDVAAVEPPGPRISRETALTIAAAVETLSPRAKAIFTMHDVEGYSATEIGLLLGIAPATVRVHLSRARQRLAEVLLP